MKKLSFSVILLILVFHAGNVLHAQIKSERQWSSYRGYLSSGVLDQAGLPESFDFRSGNNIKWKISVPGMGLSSPVIWGNRLFITSAISEADKSGIQTGMSGGVGSVNDQSVHEWKIYCIDKNSGKILWDRTACKGVPQIKRHPKSTHANASVTTNGKYAVAFFGSEGLYCYDMEGKLQWQKNFGKLQSVFFTMKNAEWEFASSPVIYEDVLLIQCDVMENSFIAAYDVSTGKELWKTERDELPGWCTPNIYKNNGKTYVALNGYKNRAGYDFKTGEEIWKMSGGGDIQIPTPITGNGMIYFCSAHGSSSPIIAVSSDAKGDITLRNGEKSNQYVKWSIPRGGSYMHTMLLYRNHLYNIDWNGTIKCLDPLTGNEIYIAKLGRANSFVASPVASDGRIYIVDEQGNVYILKDGDLFQVISEIPMDDVSLVAPAITDGSIFFRTQKYLMEKINSYSFLRAITRELRLTDRDAIVIATNPLKNIAVIIRVI